MEKLLIIVPHQDDEIIIAGPIMDQLLNRYDIRVLFTTNGDYGISSKNNIRLEESIEALKVLGVKEILFLLDMVMNGILGIYIIKKMTKYVFRSVEDVAHMLLKITKNSII